MNSQEITVYLRLLAGLKEEAADLRTSTLSNAALPPEERKYVVRGMDRITEKIEDRYLMFLRMRRDRLREEEDPGAWRRRMIEEKTKEEL